ncbi:MAG TPA: methyltransferase domain-containing protein [Candidatus Binatia bacterium]|jgi:2-polyprenyl-3-methyl-5-hydroxy-6-metoxy-1,4-benzoquinol methylase
MPVDPSYIDQIAALDFKGVEWTREKILEVRDLLSPWNHNIALPYGVYTAACEDYYPAHREIMRIVRERLGPDFSGRRIADIGCLEGYFSIECALQGAEALGIDGKLLNVRKCEFVRSVLGVERATFVLGDAMKVTRESSGRFDAVLALGLLYHLDDPHTFLANLAGLCDGFVVIDTHVALEDQPESIKEGWRPELSEMRTFTFGGKRYEGRLFREFPSGTARDVKDLSPTASLENELSVWLTEDSLIRMLHDVGFSGTEKIVYPQNADSWWSDLRKECRVLIVASSPQSRFRSKLFPDS